MNTKSLILDTIEEVAGKNVNPLLRSLAGAGMTEQELVRTMVQDGVHRISVDVSKRASADVSLSPVGSFLKRREQKLPRWSTQVESSCCIIFFSRWSRRTQVSVLLPPPLAWRRF